MKRIILAALVGMLVGQIAPAGAQSAKEGILTGVRQVYVYLIDTVRGGCLPNPGAIKNAVELKLLANGFKVLEKDKALYQPYLLVNLTGFPLTNKSKVVTGCAVHISMDLSGVALVNVPYANKDGKSTEHISYINIWDVSYLLVGPKESMQSRIKSEVEDNADEVILKILKTRQEVFAKYPHMKKNFEQVHKK